MRKYIKPAAIVALIILTGGIASAQDNPSLVTEPVAENRPQTEANHAADAGIDGDHKDKLYSKIDVHDLHIINIPLKLAEVDLTQSSDPLWAKGSRPKATKMMNFSVSPISAATGDIVLPDGSFFDAPLLRAFEGKADSYKYAAVAQQYSRRPVYCGKSKKGDIGRLICLVDDDRDGQFEGYSIARGQGGNNPLNATIMGPVQPMKTATAYTELVGTDAPTFSVTMKNCGKDWDRPHYAMNVDEIPVKSPGIDLTALLAVSNSNDLQSLMRMQQLLGGRTASAPCQQGERLDRATGIDPASIPKKGLLAQVDAFVFAVGKKSAETSLKLRAVLQPDRLYRVEGRGLIPLSVGLSYNQRDLLRSQKFDKPVIMAKGNFVASPGIKSLTDSILEFDIEHGYIGRLTKKIRIRTLLGSRSLDAGTLVYGVPMSSTRRVTINGIPQGFGRSTQPSREINTRLIWCTPVREEVAKRDKDRKRIGTLVSFTDSCISDQSGKRHTILKGRKPSFQISSFSYNAHTSTNDGPVPVERSEGNFGAPLKMKLTIAGIWSNVIHLKKQIFLGDELASEKLEYLRRASDQETVFEISGASIAFSPPSGSKDAVEIRSRKKKDWNAEEDVMVSVEGKLKAGDDIISKSSLRTVLSD